MGTHVAMLGEFSGVNVSAGHTSDLPFAVPRSLPPPMGYFQVVGALDSFVVFWV